MKRLCLILVASLALLPVQRVRGQDTFVEAGARVRMLTVSAGALAGAPGTAHTRFVGHLEGASRDSLRIRVGSTDGPLVSIDLGDIQELEISDGRKRNPGTGALVGAGVGLGLGVLAAATLDDCTVGTSRFWFDLCEGEEDVLILGSVIAGAAWGALIGMFIKSERWVDVPPAALTLAPDRGGMALGVEVRLGF